MNEKAQLSADVPSHAGHARKGVSLILLSVLSMVACGDVFAPPEGPELTGRWRGSTITLGTLQIDLTEDSDGKLAGCGMHFGNVAGEFFVRDGRHEGTRVRFFVDQRTGFPNLEYLGFIDGEDRIVGAAVLPEPHPNFQRVHELVLSRVGPPDVEFCAAMEQA